jgi:hypothetical protein
LNNNLSFDNQDESPMPDNKKEEVKKQTILPEEAISEIKLNQDSTMDLGITANNILDDGSKITSWKQLSGKRLTKAERRAKKVSESESDQQILG